MIPVELYQAMAEDCPPERRFQAIVRRDSLVTSFWAGDPAEARAKAETYRDSLKPKPKPKPKPGARKAPMRRAKASTAAGAAS
ncbi:hypothetical protein ACQVP2_07745 [Methylobacterium aquaticum]|uniref:hypothetical protein n=1 Tax=Methylobacterium aquaticum TaxID=270351 RepID=UPI003D16BFFE